MPPSSPRLASPRLAEAQDPAAAPDLLAELPVLALDCQATGTTPSQGHLLELAWCRIQAGAQPPPPTLADAHFAVEATLVALPADATIPRRVQTLTGIRERDLGGAPSAQEAWRRLLASNPAGVAVAHYARFEEPWLRGLHAASPDAQAPFPLRLVCTHDIARRLFPDLPRRGIRAVSGYLGQPLQELKRAACHVEATAFIWSHLVARLHHEHGIASLDDLAAWLAAPKPRRPAGSGKLGFPLPRERRLALPQTPGVYRMLGRDGSVLYVGKASHLKRRVNSYFQKRREGSHKTFEMLVQVWDLDVTEVATALEAALLEHDEIKRLSPPYNIALRAREREIVFVDRSLELAAAPDPVHRIGPLPDALSVRICRFWIGSLTVAGHPLASLDTLADSYLPTDPEAAADEHGSARDPLPLYQAALERVRERHALPAHEALSIERLWRLGHAMHRQALAEAAAAREAAALEAAERKAAAEAASSEADSDEPEPPAAPDPTAEPEPARAPDADAEPEPDEAPRRWVWTPEALAATLEESLRRTVAHALRARWLAWLADATLVWQPRGRKKRAPRRMLVLHDGRITHAADLPPDQSPPDLPERPRRLQERLPAFDVDTTDRMRVLTTELRRLVAEGHEPELWFATRRRMTSQDLARLFEQL